MINQVSLQLSLSKDSCDIFKNPLDQLAHILQRELIY